MCYTCYKSFGEPKIINNATKAAAALADEVYKFSLVGGNCHIVLDDFNIEDRHIDSCLEALTPDNLHEHNAEELEIERKCMMAFKALSIPERASALAIHERWI